VTAADTPGLTAGASVRDVAVRLNHRQHPGPESRIPPFDFTQGVPSLSRDESRQRQNLMRYVTFVASPRLINLHDSVGSPRSSFHTM
jgi:hypothetical protein